MKSILNDGILPSKAHRPKFSQHLSNRIEPSKIFNAIFQKIYFCCRIAVVFLIIFQLSSPKPETGLEINKNYACYSPLVLIF